MCHNSKYLETSRLGTLLSRCKTCIRISVGYSSHSYSFFRPGWKTPVLPEMSQKVTNGLLREMKLVWRAEIQMKLRCDHFSPKNFSHGVNEIRTHGPCVSAAVLVWFDFLISTLFPCAVVFYQLSYEDPQVGSRQIYRVHLYPWQEWAVKWSSFELREYRWNWHVTRDFQGKRVTPPYRSSN